MKLDDLVMVALDASPLTVILQGDVPEKGSASHRGTESEESSPLRSQIWSGQRKQNEEDGKQQSELVRQHC